MFRDPRTFGLHQPLRFGLLTRRLLRSATRLFVSNTLLRFFLPTSFFKRSLRCLILRTTRSFLLCLTGRGFFLRSACRFFLCTTRRFLFASATGGFFGCTASRFFLS